MRSDNALCSCIAWPPSLTSCPSPPSPSLLPWLPHPTSLRVSHFSGPLCRRHRPCTQRSKSKRHYRAVKRSDSASAYKLAEDIRVQRLSAQLKQSALKPRALTDKEEWERKQAGFETDEEDEEDATKEEGGEFLGNSWTYKSQGHEAHDSNPAQQEWTSKEDNQPLLRRLLLVPTKRERTPRRRGKRSRLRDLACRGGRRTGPAKGSRSNRLPRLTLPPGGRVSPCSLFSLSLSLSARKKRNRNP